MDLPEQIAAVRKPATGNLREELAKRYAEVCANFGYSPVKSFVDLLVERKDERIAFEIQFGNRGEFYGSIRDMLATGANLCVLVTSSRAHTVPFKDLKDHISANFNIGTKHMLFVDIENSRFMKVNFEAEQVERGFFESARRPPEEKREPASVPLFRERRRMPVPRHKIIKGRKGEHKVQD